MEDVAPDDPVGDAPVEWEREAVARGMVVYKNEFAMVAIGRHETSSGPRLQIVDLASGAEVYLDPIELEGLTRLRHQAFAPLLDPSDVVVEGEPDPDQV
ncbi:MAG: dihydrodiol dehydrogenase [Nitriliruptorales bacterium]|nr:dihydrodiol dehydrogenase [Nitriliruptorales bacterium]